MNTSKIKTKQQVDVVIDILQQIGDHQNEIDELLHLRKTLPDDIKSSVLQSHRAICEVKNMEMGQAYGWDPSIYYASAIAGEAGEMVNGVIKQMRFEGKNSPTIKNRLVEAIRSELPDVIIYSYILAHIIGIDLDKEVQHKTSIVIDRAKNGYYGGKLR